MEIQASKTLATTTAELHVATSDERNKWEKQTSGVVCFVKDCNKRSYFIRFYDENTLVWQYDTRKTKGTKFTTNDSSHAFVAAGYKIVFLDNYEADNFKKVMMEKLNTRQKRQTTLCTSTETGASNESENTGLTRKSLDKSKPKLTNEDIKKTTNVQQVSAVLDINSLDPDMRSIFEFVGIDQDHIDLETLDFLYDFVEKKGGKEAFAKEYREQQMKSQVPPPPNRAGPPPPSTPSYIKRPGAPPPPPSSNINRTGPLSPPPPSIINRAGLPQPPPPSNINRAGAPPPPSPSNINMAGPPPSSNINRAGARPPPPHGNINRAGAPPLPPRSKAVSSPRPNRAGPPPPPNPSKEVHPPPPNRAGPPPPPPPSKVELPKPSNQDKFGLLPPPSRNTSGFPPPPSINTSGLHPPPSTNTSGLPPPPPSRVGPRLSSPSNTDTEPADFFQETNQGATGESNPIKQQIMQLLLQNPAEITDFLYDIIDKRGGVAFIKDSLAQQMNTSHTTQENDQQPPVYTMQNVSDYVSDVQAASERSNRSEVPGRKKTSDNVSGRRNAGEVPGATGGLSPDYELSSDMFDDDDDEWDDLNGKGDQE